MRKVAIVLITALIAAVAWAEVVSGPQAVVSQVAGDVEADLDARRASGVTEASATLAFDPLQRAQTNLVSWTRVPSREELMPAIPGEGSYSAAVGASGLTREYFGRINASLIFPKDADTASAIRRMAKGQVSAAPNYCARTMREAMGWGLGDAHDWTALPSRGYTQRPAGAEAQPGDIVVWPFTYGSRNSQHIGIAVGTDRGTRLLSNLSGTLGLTRILPGYGAYWKQAA